MIRRLFSLLALLFSLTAAAQNFLPPTLAFRPTLQALDGETLEVRFQIADGYYLYQDKFRFRADPENIQLGTPLVPRGKEKQDENFGRIEALYKEVLIRVPVVRDHAGTLNLKLDIPSQGCAEEGICYPPQQQVLSVELPDPATTPRAASPAAGDETSRIARLLHEAGFWLVIASFFGFGLLLSLTPCVLPMVPILSGMIVGAGGAGRSVSLARSFSLSLAYVLGMAVSYAAAGAAAGLSGTLLSTSLQNQWVLGSFALVFVVLAFSMFGFYTLQMPAFLQSRVSGVAQPGRGSLPGLALMGALSALIVGPCVAAPLAGALLYIGQTGNAVLGGSALFSMALGMGVPLLLVGLSAGTLLPRVGPWMESINKAFGFILLGTALWLVSPFLPLRLEMALWGILLLVPPVLMQSYLPLPKKGSTFGQRIRKLSGVLMMIASLLLLANAVSGGKEVDELVARFKHGSRQQKVLDQHLPFVTVRSLAEVDAHVKAAAQPVMLDFYADWCITCKQMERKTFADPAVKEALAGWTLLRADVTANSADDKALLARFKLYGPPGILFFDQEGAVNETQRVVGFQDSAAFLATLAAVRGN